MRDGWLRRAVTGVLLGVVFAAGLAPLGSAQRLDGRFEVGDVFPDLALPSLDDGTAVRLSDFRGHKVMLHVFASW